MEKAIDPHDLYKKIIVSRVKSILLLLLSGGGGGGEL